MNHGSSWKTTITLAFAASLLLLGGCSENKKATKACKASPTMEACQQCCSDNGASGHSAKYIGKTKECKCLGGS